MGAPIRFLFDFISPYAYLAWKAAPALAARHGRALEPVPVLFAGLLDAHGTRGPAEVPAKRVYVFKDALRRAALLGVPFAPPPSHPFNPLLALRACAVDMPADQRHALIDALFDATWGGGPGVTDAAVVADRAARVGLDPAALLADAQSPTVKARVRAATEAAVAAGVFGVPTLLVDGELFWGLDSFPCVEQRVRGEDPVTDALLERWRDLPASSARPAARRA